MTKPSEFFASPEEFSVMGKGTSVLISVLNLGRMGDTPTAIHASRKGCRITLDGRTICRGRTPVELMERFKAEVAKAKAGTE